MKKIIITEAQKSDAERRRMNLALFKGGVASFLENILKDPVGADVNERLSLNSITRDKLLQLLTDNGIVIKKDRLHDRDEEGKPVHATMKRSYVVNTSHLEEKLEDIYNAIFGDDTVDECTSCGSVGGAYVTKLQTKPIRQL